MNLKPNDEKQKEQRINLERSKDVVLIMRDQRNN